MLSEWDVGIDFRDKRSCIPVEVLLPQQVIPSFLTRYKCMQDA